MNVQVPFGGKKQPGLGREFGEYVRSLEFLYTFART